MQIALVDFIAWDYSIDTVYQRPLGGSQSALCYLAEQLVQRGHDVHLINNARLPGVSRGVVHLPLEKARPETWRAFDAVVLLNAVKQGAAIRPLLKPEARMISWLQHADDQPAVRGLAMPDYRDAFDGYAFVSGWQKQRFIAKFGIVEHKTKVFRNCVGPAFQNRFAPSENILSAKKRPFALAYTSTPFRGLDILVHVFPAIRSRVPNTILRIYSSMGVYQAPADADAAQYGELYRQCRESPGIEYIGSLPQAELADRLRDVAILAYPNHFPETSCIAVMEAMASGCQILTTELGALPETTAGFGKLLPPGDSWLDYSERFVEAAVELLEDLKLGSDRIETDLRRQVESVNADNVWSARAIEWEQWLT